MARIFITGSADGLGQLAAKQLVNEGHEVVLHARNDARGKEALAAVLGAQSVLTGDLSSIEDTKQLADKVNRLGAFDAVIHNAGVYQASGDLIVKVNTLAPYILTCLIKPPKRLVYMSSGMHTGGQSKLDLLATDFSKISYSDSKLHDLILAKAVARFWPDVYSNAVDPGWVPTKMGGAGATDNLQKGYETQTWLAVSDGTDAQVSGSYFYHQKARPYHDLADDINVQDEFLKTCEQLTGVKFPESNA
ncbi:MAG: SDR family NAD(P)-dependent oxidoreductase [Fulvivirga sp.]